MITFLLRLINVGSLSNAIKVHAPSFTSVSTAQNLIATTLGTMSIGGAGTGYSLAMTTSGLNSLVCDGSNTYGMAITQSLTGKL